jgi:hypothetical protein
MDDTRRVAAQEACQRQERGNPSIPVGDTPTIAAGRQIRPGIFCRIASDTDGRFGEFSRFREWPAACSRASGGCIRDRSFARCTRPDHHNADLYGRRLGVQLQGARRRGAYSGDITERLRRPARDGPGWSQAGQ